MRDKQVEKECQRETWWQLVNGLKNWTLSTSKKVGHNNVWSTFKQTWLTANYHELNRNFGLPFNANCHKGENAGENDNSFQVSHNGAPDIIEHIHFSVCCQLEKLEINGKNTLFSKYSALLFRDWTNTEISLWASCEHKVKERSLMTKMKGWGNVVWNSFQVQIQ